MPHFTFVREIDRSRRPPFTNESTSFLRVSGWMRCRVRLVEGEQPVLIRRELEEVVVLVDELDLARALRARVVRVQLVLGVVRLVGDAVPALVLALVDLASVVEHLHEVLDPALVALLGRADEVVVADVEQLPDVEELRRDGVHPVLGRRAVLLGRLGDLLAVLVESGEEPDVVATHPPVARERVRGDGRVRGSEVRNRVHVVDRRCQIE